MQFSFLSQFSSLGTALLLFLGMILVYLLAFKFSLQKGRNTTSEGFGPIEGALLGLLALLLAFTFAMSVSRYDTRRNILVEEANLIGTAVLRSDLYPEAERMLLRADFQAYVEARILFFEAGFDQQKIDLCLIQSENVSARIWRRASVLARDPGNLISSQQMIPALNSMIDIVATRNAARHATVPDSVLWMLFVLCLVSSFLVGYDRRDLSPSWVVVGVFALMISASIFLILDLDRPAQGLITLEETNKNLVDLRKMFAND